MNGAELVARLPQLDEPRMPGERGGQPRLTERRAPKANGRNANLGLRRQRVRDIVRFLAKSRDPERKNGRQRLLSG
jgi:hypothetical protein